MTGIVKKTRERKDQLVQRWSVIVEVAACHLDRCYHLSKSEPSTVATVGLVEQTRKT